MARSVQWMTLGLLALCVVVGSAIVGCSSGASEPSQAEKTAQLNERVRDMDFGGDQGKPDSADCTPAGANYECTVSFGQKSIQFTASIKGDGPPYDVGIDLSPEQKAICDAVELDVKRLRAMAAPTISATDATTAFNAYRKYAKDLAAFRPRSDWGQQSKPVLLAASRKGVEAIDSLIAGTTSPAQAEPAILKASKTFDAQFATVPCPTDSSK